MITGHGKTFLLKNKPHYYAEAQLSEGYSKF